jgi:hypothetical protein
MITETKIYTDGFCEYHNTIKDRDYQDWVQENHPDSKDEILEEYTEQQWKYELDAKKKAKAEYYFMMTGFDGTNWIVLRETTSEAL